MASSHEEHMTDHDRIIRFKLGELCPETARLKADFVAAVRANGTDMSEVLREAVSAYVAKHRAKS
jgi:hypothetical protein